MSFKFINAIDLFAFIEAVKAANGGTDMRLQSGTSTQQTQTNYFGIRQVMRARIDRAGGTQPESLQFNPVTLEGEDAVVTTTQQLGCWADDASDFGLPDRVLYWTSAVTVFPSAYNPATGTPGAADGLRPFQLDQGTATDATPGGYGTNGSPFSQYLQLFYGLTDGVPGGLWTTGNHTGGTNLVGPGVYPGGLALARLANARLLNNTVVDDAYCWIDMTNAQVAGVAYADLPGRTQSTIQIFSEQPIRGVSFAWTSNQFIPDPDSSAAAPKGEIMCTSDTSSGGLVIAGSAFQHVVFVRFVDFNPLNVPAQGGAPTRTHGRVTITNAIEFNNNPMFDIPGAGIGTVDGTNTRPFYDRSSRRMCMLAASGNGAGSTNAVFVSAMGYWSRQLQPTTITPPIALDVPRTNDIVDYEVFVSDNLDVAVGGVRVDWALFRNSTEDELLTITGGGGTTSTVANGPIDTTGGGVVTLSITADAVPLVLTTDYTVVASTGVITWVTSQVGKVVLATYEHRATNASPAHGTLLTGQSTTGDDGRAFAQILYLDDDDLVGKLDRLTANFVP